MKGVPSRDLVNSLKVMYPTGKRVRLNHTSDSYTKMCGGELGTISFVDDIGTIFIDWDCGSKLGMVFGEDSISIID